MSQFFSIFISFRSGHEVYYLPFLYKPETQSITFMIFSIIYSIQISHVISNQNIDAPHYNNHFLIYNKELPTDAKNITTFEICDIWSRKINGECVRCDTTNAQQPCKFVEFSPLCLRCTETGCLQGYKGNNCQQCASGFYQDYAGCSQCILSLGPLYTYLTYMVLIYLMFVGSSYAAHYSLLPYIVKTAQLFVALSTLNSTNNLTWMVGLQTFILDPLAVQWECFKIPTGYAPLLGLVMVFGFWALHVMFWGFVKVYTAILKKTFSDSVLPDMKRVIDSSMGAWTFYLEWQSPILVYRFVQGLQYEWIPNLIGLIVMITLITMNFVGANWLKSIVFPGTIPFVRFGPAFYKLKPDFFYFYLLTHFWWGLLAINTFLLHPYMQRIVIVIALLSRSIMHYYNVFKRPVTWYGELIVLIFGMIWCFTLDKSYSYLIPIFALLANFAVLGLEISWCHQKTWVKNLKPEVVIYFHIV
eukprot:NODE_548_length_6182_cov_1.284564.p1 type:complete len:472 gc:universal NODE_548_length_6182_cov_1.284564:2309-894(-)